MFTIRQVGGSHASGTFKLCSNSDGTGVVASVAFPAFGDTSGKWIDLVLPVSKVEGSYFVCVEIVANSTADAHPSITVGNNGSYINGK